MQIHMQLQKHKDKVNLVTVIHFYISPRCKHSNEKSPIFMFRKTL